MLKTFWLSFCDGAKPTGERFLGACLVDVTQDDADEAIVWLAIHRPQARAGAEWIAAAQRKAWRERCNPGGEVAFCDISDAPADVLATYPRNRLMTRSELEAWGPLDPMDAA